MITDEAVGGSHAAVIVSITQVYGCRRVTRCSHRGTTGYYPCPYAGHTLQSASQLKVSTLKLIFMLGITATVKVSDIYGRGYYRHRYSFSHGYSDGDA